MLRNENIIAKKRKILLLRQWKIILKTFYKIRYSVVGLVLPRGEEQISGPSALSKLKKPSKRSQKGPRSCQKYSKLCYDHFGGRLEASNPPPLFTLSQSEGY